MESGNTRFLYFCAIAINLSSVSIGTSFAWASPSLPKLNGQVPGYNPLPEPLTTFQGSLIAALLGIGGMFGPFCSVLSDKVGRKRALFLSSVSTCISYLIIAFAKNVWLFLLARFLSGFAVGWYLASTPIYVAEISQKHNRGIMGCFLKINVTIGMLLVYAVGPYLSIQWTGIICLIPPLLLFILVGILVPESPHYLVAKGRKEEAAAALSRLRGSKNVEDELTEIVQNVEESFNTKKDFFFLLKNKDLFKCLLIPTGLICFQQLCGVNAILFYLQTIFDATQSDLPPEINAMIIGVVQFLASIVTPFFIDTLGRKFFLYVSGFGTLISLISIGTYFHLQTTDYPIEGLNWLPITSLIVFLTTYTMGFGPLPFTILGEIFPPNMKTAGSSLSISVGYVFTFLVTMTFPHLKELIGVGESFWLFSGFSFLSILFTKFLVPETKQKSFVEIQKMLNIHPT